MSKNKIASDHNYSKEGIFYFRRRVPSDLSHCETTRQVAFSQRTKAAVVAATRATITAQQFDDLWYHLKAREDDLPGKHLLRMQHLTQAAVAPQAS